MEGSMREPMRKKFPICKRQQEKNRSVERDKYRADCSTAAAEARAHWNTTVVAKLPKDNWSSG